jgi:aldehyde dehydrogenase (NAD+)
MGHTEEHTDSRSIDASAVVAQARLTFDSGVTRHLSWRLEQLGRLEELLTSEEDRLLEALAADLGKPAIEAYTADLAITRNEVAYVAKRTTRWAKARTVSLPMNMKPGKAWVQPQPLGVALLISPWNYPVQLVIQPLAAALAAGNTVVIKPSELAPATSSLLAELIPSYLDPDAVQVVEGAVESSTALLEERFDHIFFTGSPGVGRIVMAAAARHLTPVTLELGGKSPVLVDDSADMEVAGRRIAWAKWLNAGQTCIAPDYALVTAPQRDQLVDCIGSAWDEFSGGDVQASPDFSRIVTAAHASRLEGLLADHGGVIAVGGQAEPESRFVAPTVVVDPDLSSDLMTEEIFGPILPVVSVDSMDDAVDFVNRREKPLALYAFGSQAAAESLVERTTSGSALINHLMLQASVSALPFGGVGQSGMGRYHGRSGFNAFSNLRAVMKKAVKPDPKLGYPPYTAFKERVFRRLL